MHELCIGEIDQIRDKYRMNQNLLTYMRRIKRKTALLISSSTEMGALAANVDEHHVKLLKKYGYYIGMSYQIIDDILDFTSTEKELGKPVGNDLINGNLTLPALLALDDPDIYQSIEKIFTSSKREQEEIEQLINKIKTSENIERAYQSSQDYLRKAFQVLEKLPDIEAKVTLKQIAVYLSKRKH